MLPRAHPLIVRLCHWLVVLAVLLMVGSGWRIYNAAPLFGFRFPSELTIGGWLGGALQWHFAAMWLLGGAGVVYLIYICLSGRLGRMFWPVRPLEVMREVSEALRLKLEHDDLEVYNHTQRLAYLTVMAALVVVVTSGLVLWKQVQFPILRELMGGYEVARYVHFGAMAVIVGFIVLHVALVLVVPHTLSAMVGIFKRPGESK